jgi:6,7-dimethyl-8-ribityllumazine synthase
MTLQNALLSRVKHHNADRNGPSAERTKMAIPTRVQEIKNLTAFAAIVALGNLGVTIWHLRLASELNPALSFAEATRISVITGVLTLAGVSLLWAQRRLAGSLVLVVVFAIGLVIGSLEHFFTPGPNNVFDAGVSGVAFLFRISVALLVALEIAGLWGAARLIRSAWRSAS